MEQTDDDLIRAYLSGHGSAADQLVRRHLPRVRSLLFQLVLNHDWADELTQEVFVNVLHGLRGFRGESSFETWLHRVTLNAASRASQRERRRHHRPLSEFGPKAEEATAADRPDARLLERERQDRVTVALGTLSPQLRAAIVLTVMQGLSAVEAAELEGCPVGTMYWRIHEARRRLRTELKDWIE